MQTVEINFQDLVQKKYEKEHPEEIQKEEEPKEQENNGESSSDDGYVPLEPGQSRLTSVISNIERMYEETDDLGYDREDSFIDDSEMVLLSEL
jgi:hypothetical protein